MAFSTLSGLGGWFSELLGLFGLCSEPAALVVGWMRSSTVCVGRCDVFWFLAEVYEALLTALYEFRGQLATVSIVFIVFRSTAWWLGDSGSLGLSPDEYVTFLVRLYMFSFWTLSWDCYFVELHVHGVFCYFLYLDYLKDAVESNPQFLSLGVLKVEYGWSLSSSILFFSWGIDLDYVFFSDEVFDLWNFLLDDLFLSSNAARLLGWREEVSEPSLS